MVTDARDLKDIRLSRSSRLVKDPARLSVLVIGAGSIGSNAVHLLVSMGIEDIIVIDDDTVGEENIFPAFFSAQHVGELKIAALKEDIEERTGLEIGYMEGRFPHERLDGITFDIVIIGTDTKASRQYACHSIKDTLNEGGVWIDARMGGPECEVIALRREREEDYRNYRDMLQGGGEAQLPCGEKATAPITKGFINGFIGLVVSAIANGTPIMSYQSLNMENGEYLFVEERQT